MPAFSKRKRFGAGIILGLAFMVWWGWATLKRPEAVGKIHASRSVTVSSASEKRRLGASSRMIEADPAETQLAAKDNAATEWRKAFALAEKLTLREKEILRWNSKTQATDEEIAALLTKIDPIILLLRQGAEKPGFDWGIRNFSAFTKIPHLQKAWELVQFAAWDAERRFATQPDEAVANLLAIDKIANSLQLGWISQLTNLTSHGVTSKLIEGHAAELSPENRSVLLHALQQPDLLQAIQTANRTEVEFGRNTIELLKRGQNAGGESFNNLEKQMVGEVYGNDPSALENTNRAYDKLTAISEEAVFWTDEKFEKWYAAYLKSSGVEGEHNPFKNLKGTRDAVRRALLRQSMTSAGLAYFDEGNAAFSRIRDPFTGKPFAYRKVDESGTFELQSEMLYRGTPSIVTFKMPAGN